MQSECLSKSMPLGKLTPMTETDNSPSPSTTSEQEESQTTPKKHQRWWFRWVAVLLAIFVALLIGEIALRITGYVPRYAGGFKSFHIPDPEFGFRGKPNFEARFSKVEFDVWVKHNASGFRVHENQPSSSAKTDLYVLGDSFTWGHGVDQGEVFTDLLQKRFPVIHVHNHGRSGTGTVIHYHIFNEHVKPKLKEGDWVMVAFFCSRTET